jgi:hypothetical protein
LCSAQNHISAHNGSQASKLHKHRPPSRLFAIRSWLGASGRRSGAGARQSSRWGRDAGRGTLPEQGKSAWLIFTNSNPAPGLSCSPGRTRPRLFSRFDPLGRPSYGWSVRWVRTRGQVLQACARHGRGRRSDRGTRECTADSFWASMDSFLTVEMRYPRNGVNSSR